LDKALRTREYSEISKKLRSFSGYKKLEKLDKTPPLKFWAHGRSARLEVSKIPITSSPQTSPSQHTSSLNSSFRKSTVGSFTNRVAHFLRKRTFDGSEVSPSHTPNISERSGEQDYTVSSPNQSASISCFGSKEVVLRPTVPWWSNEINREKRKVRKTERVWRKRKLAVFFEIYIARLADFSTLLQRIKTEFFCGKVAELKGNRQALHQLIEGSLDCKRRAPVLPSQLDSKSLSAEFSKLFKCEQDSLCP
jgi:hypothetical protein